MWTRTVPLTLALSVVSCGGSQLNRYVWNDVDEATGQRVDLRQGPMPADETFTGVYQSPQIGEVQLSQTGDLVVGQYEYDRGSCHVRARLEGNAVGNLARLAWREDHRQCGRIEPVTGRSFFLYTVENTGGVRRGRLFGRWGYQEDEHGGGPWIAFKIPRRQPTFNDQNNSQTGAGQSSPSEQSSGAGTRTEPNGSSGGESPSSGGNLGL